MTRQLLENEIVSRFGADALQGLPDAATVAPATGKLTFSTDGFVVQPLQFPGGSIGHLAVHGTVNDLAVAGSKPRWLSLSMILEEGLPLTVLREILDDVCEAARQCDVQIVTGDTKVVGRGQCDGMYLITAGIGEQIDAFDLSVNRCQPGDVILVNGTLGDHGMAVMAMRQGFDVGPGLTSDTCTVHTCVEALQPFGNAIRWMRDPTRGGAAAVLNEAIENKAIGVLLHEEKLPFSSGARSIAELLGFDLLNSACEGRLIAVCAADVADKVLTVWQTLQEGQGAAAIGVITDTPGHVVLETVTGGHRLVDVPHGELLPRIC